MKKCRQSCACHGRLDPPAKRDQDFVRACAVDTHIEMGTVVRAGADKTRAQNANPERTEIYSYRKEPLLCRHTVLKNILSLKHLLSINFSVGVFRFLILLFQKTTPKTLFSLSSYVQERTSSRCIVDIDISWWRCRYCRARPQPRNYHPKPQMKSKPFPKCWTKCLNMYMYVYIYIYTYVYIYIYIIFIHTYYTWWTHLSSILVVPFWLGFVAYVIFLGKW